ncbi:MAG: LacI family transcriptional regulator [Ruminococcaceae bacterium]|nr:LacI family transcriptional regulator [Oscillospiraceae bacterium]
MTTIYDIAKYTGLSPATVSRVLSGKKTSEANRQKILAAAKELNYHNMAYTDAANPYRTARIKSAESNTILLVPGRNGCDGVYAAARDLGYTVQLINSLHRSEEYVRSQLDSGAALGLLTHEVTATDFLQDFAQHYPIVTVGYNGMGLNCNSIWIDYYDAMQVLMQELHQAGCRRVWIYTSEIQQQIILQLSDAQELGIEEVRSIIMGDTFFSQAFGDHTCIVDEIMSLPLGQRPDGLIMPNSVVASCVVNMLRTRGVAIPDEMAVVSLIGGEHDRACEPYLTSILPPYYELGYEAMRVLDSLISGKICPVNVHYPYKMHYGGSTRKDLAPFGELTK